MAEDIPSLAIFRTPYTLQDALIPSKPPLLTPRGIKDNNLNIEFFESEDHPFNKRGFKYKSCRPNPLFPMLLYSTSDVPSYGARFSYFDRSQGILVNKEIDIITTESGWRSARANIGVDQGSWYFEFEIINANNEVDSAHVRIGVGRKEASLEAPIGYDAYGYSLRDIKGQKVHLSRPKQFFQEVENGFKTGDVIGMLIELPSLEVQKKIALRQIQNKTPGEPDDAEEYYNSKLINNNPNVAASNPLARKKKKRRVEDDERDQISQISSVNDISRDQIPIKYKNELYYEQYEYTSTLPFQHLLNPVTVFGEKAVKDSKPFKPAILPNSKITIYKNSKLVGVAFEDLYAFLPPSSKLNNSQLKDKQYNNDGNLGYYPMASVFKSGMVKLNPGPFKNLQGELKRKVESGEVKCLYERYNEKVAEDVVFDIIDEVESEIIETKLK